MTEQAVEKFAISYDAEAGDFQEHQIDAYKLGNAIIGMYDIVALANEQLNDGARVDLKVASPVVDEGSVIVDFLLFGSPAALSVLKYLGFSAAGSAIAGGTLIEVVQALKSRRVVSVVIEDGDENASIKVDGEVIECNKFIAKLAVDKKVREALHSVIEAPIIGHKDAVFKVLDEDRETIKVIPESKASDFSPLPIGSLESEEITRERITGYFIRVDFDEDKGWRIKRGDGQEHSVEIADEEFLARVGRNKQSFRKGDLFEMEIEVQSKYRATRATHVYKVLKVTRHFVDKRRRIV